MSKNRSTSKPAPIASFVSSSGAATSIDDVDPKIAADWFQSFISTSREWFFEMDASLSYSAFYGATEQEVLDQFAIAIGKKRWNLVLQENILKDPAHWARHIADLYSRRAFTSFRYSMISLRGRQYWCDVAGRPVYDADGNFIGYHGSVRDVTAVKQYQDALLTALNAAEQANRAKTDFLSRMSHELRTPLNGVIGFSELMSAGVAGDMTKKQLGYLELILKAGFHLLGLIDEILDLSTIDGDRLKLHNQNVDINALVRDCIAMVGPIEEAQTLGVTVSAELESSPLYFVGDKRRLQQVLLNLLSNAIKYNRQGGSVTLTARSAPDDRGILITIADTGRGIAPEETDKIFEPFERLGIGSEQIEGTGIGLTITKRLIERMGGMITVASKPDEGTRFEITLPPIQDEVAEHGL